MIIWSIVCKKRIFKYYIIGIVIICIFSLMCYCGLFFWGLVENVGVIKELIVDFLVWYWLVNIVVDIF